MNDVAPYDLSAFTTPPEDLPRWHQELSQPLPAGEWAGLAIAPSGHLLLAGSALVECDARGVELRRIELPAPATAVTADELRVVVALGDRLLLLDDKLGAPRQSASLGEQADIVSLSVHEDRIAAADAGQRLVWLLDGAGNPQGRIDGIAEDEEHGFRLPSRRFACIWDGGDVLIANPGRRRVERWRDGAKLGQFGEAGMTFGRFSGCCNPVALAGLDNGDIVTAEKGLPRVCVFSPSGELRAVIAAPTDFDPATQGLIIAIAPDDSCWILDPARRQLRQFVE